MTESQSAAEFPMWQVRRYRIDMNLADSAELRISHYVPNHRALIGKRSFLSGRESKALFHCPVCRAQAGAAEPCIWMMCHRPGAVPSKNGRRDTESSPGSTRMLGETAPVGTQEQFVVFSEFAKCWFFCSQRPDLNRGPTDYEFPPSQTETPQEDPSPDKTEKFE